MMGWKEEWKTHLKKMSDNWIDQNLNRYQALNDEEKLVMERKRDLLKERKAQIVKANVTGNLAGFQRCGQERTVGYQCRTRLLIKQKSRFYLEEIMHNKRARFQGDQLISDEKVGGERPEFNPESVISDDQAGELRGKGKGFIYNRLNAVRYADRWWNSENPDYRAFDVDCTNYVSQCLFAGNAPMHGQYKVNAGWWYDNRRWSLSWAVAHSLRWYLASDNSPLQAIAVDEPTKLQPGDVICYDFEGDGRFDHSTIVTEKDAEGMPLVNAHTTDSRHRYWSYKDSSAWTPGIQYKFYHINAD